MNLRPSHFALVALLVAAPQFARSQDATPAGPPAAAPAPAPAPAPGGGQEEKKTEIDKRMDRMGKAFRQLKKQISDPAQNPSSIDLISKMIAAAKEAEGFTPAKAADLPADQRPQFVADYVAGLKDMEAKLQKLSDTVAAGDNATATTMYQDVFALEKKDHKQFRPPQN